MTIYPYIAHYNGTENYRDSRLVSKYYYICTRGMDDINYITPSADWFNKR